MKFLRPLRLKSSYVDAVEKELHEFFLEVMFKPLGATGAIQFRNAKDDPLIKAILSGKIIYADGVFTGQFNARISKVFRDLEATFNKRRQAWTIESVPAEVQMAVAEASARAAVQKANVIKVIDGMSAAARERLEQKKLDGTYQWALRHADKDFKQTIKRFTVAPELTDMQIKGISQQWGRNLELYINDFTEKQILSLRQQVTQHVAAGGRAETLADILQHSYRLSRDKAKFLARQETSLMMASFHEQRYKDVGISKYKWSTSHDSHVRPDHKALDGRLFTWDSPPVTDRATGRRSNPGQDYGCRCVAIPVWE